MVSSVRICSDKKTNKNSTATEVFGVWSTGQCGRLPSGVINDDCASPTRFAAQYKTILFTWSYRNLPRVTVYYHIAFIFDLFGIKLVSWVFFYLSCFVLLCCCVFSTTTCLENKNYHNATCKCTVFQNIWPRLWQYVELELSVYKTFWCAYY